MVIARRNPRVSSVEDEVRQPQSPSVAWKAIAAIVALTALVGGVVVALWWAGTRGLKGAELVSARLDALKVGLSVGVAAGGLFALYLAWRRQRSTEADLDNRERALAHQLDVAAAESAHRERVANASELDAAARRITDLYTKAAEQLGSDKAPVRLAGLYALERLADDNESQRQTIVNLLCAYLRMPHDVVVEESLLSSENVAVEVFRDRFQEQQVRLTAQRILSTHLRDASGSSTRRTVFWDGMTVDLTGAALIDFVFTKCNVLAATFRSASFYGYGSFRAAKFQDTADFQDCNFFGQASFRSASFPDTALYRRCKFFKDVTFRSATFGRHVSFREAEFSGAVSFRNTVFDGHTSFRSVTFDSGPEIHNIAFGDGIPSEIRSYVQSD